jgi:hypothetical protein
MADTQHHYLLSALPGLTQIHQELPLTIEDFLGMLDDLPGPRAVAQAVLLSGDLLQRQAMLAGELPDPTPAVLTVAQLRDEAPLPDYLVVDTDTTGQAFPLPDDLMQEAYFRHVRSVGQSQGCTFLLAWTGFEAGLRNALAEARARSLDLDAAHYRVATDIADDPDDFASLINEWNAAATPLDALEVLDQARWTWLTSHDAWFSFSADEVAAYAAKLVLVHRWDRLRRSQKEQ